MEAPSMVQRSGDTLIIRSVVSGDQIFLGRSATGESEKSSENNSCKFVHDAFEDNQLTIGDPTNESIEEIINNNNSSTSSLAVHSVQAKKDDETSLPQCKIKRNYSCNNCSYFTQNPRHFLAHLRDIHGEKIIINECKHCLYASRHYQKLVRHMKMVHGSTDGLEEQAQSRKRASQLAREEKKRKIQHLASVGIGASNVNSASGIDNVHDESILAMQTTTTQPISMLSKSPSIVVSSAVAATSASISAIASESANQLNSEILDQKFIKCTLCDFTTLYRTQMVEHEREEHNKTKFFRCQKCSYVTHIKARFSKHVKYHSMPMIKCVMCDFRTPYKWNLDRHMKNHGGAGPFKCSACNFTADIKQSLTVHEMNHHVPPVGHASGMSMARRRNKVGGTDLPDYSVINICDNSSGGDAADNNSNDGFDSSSEGAMKKTKYDMMEQEYQLIPADLSQKASTAAASVPKKAARPIPNLIPIQPMTLHPNDAMNLTMRNKNRIRPVDDTMLKEMPEIRAKPQHSVLKDFASLFVSEEVFDGSETSQLSPVSNASSAKRKNTNFFNELKEKFAAGNRDGNNLTCECGHASKCLSEAIIHKKTCGKIAEKRQSISPVNLTINNCGGSTRCQYCRHRCKTSTDLYIHMQSCAEARSSADSYDSGSEVESNNGKVDVSGDLTDEGMIDLVNEPHPMENKVFVWNKMPQPSSTNANDNQDNNKSISEMQRDEMSGPISEDSENNDEEKADDSTYYGVETAPGYGEVTKKMNPDDEAMTSSLKKVFKCPHCSFWASTASRFHVHIVGHLNKKPFECSLCSYRSNWRWDITKHIRLKTIRDISHKSAKVLMNDETGRRNYTKYNKYITLMKVTDEDGDPKLLKSGEMTPSQEAAVSFSRKKFDSGAEQSSNDRMSPQDEEKPFSLTQNALLFDISNLNTNLNQLNTNAENAMNANGSSQFTNEVDKPTEGDGTKKVSFKCKKCNFRHINRDVVLAHVKGHYKEANQVVDDRATTSPLAPLPGLNISNANEFNNNVYVNGILSAMNAGKLLLQQHQQMSSQPITEQVLPQIRIQSLNQLSGNPSQILLADVKLPARIPSMNPANTANPSMLSVAAAAAITTTPTTATTTSPTTNNENGEVDEASSGLTSVNGWRGPAPYRCGHCHQVSNWKHVIQRHCRLKHDGDIQIEIKAKGSNDVYQPLAMQQSVPAAAIAPIAISTAMETTSSIVTPSLSAGLPEKESQSASLSLITKQYPIKLPLLKDVLNHKPMSDMENNKEVSALSVASAVNNNQAIEMEQRNLIINLLTNPNIVNQSILCNGNLFAVTKSTDLHCKLCNFEAINEFVLNQHIQSHLSECGSSLINLTNTNQLSASTSTPLAIVVPKIATLTTSTTATNVQQSTRAIHPIDLDEAIITNKVPNKAYVATTDTMASPITITSSPPQQLPSQSGQSTNCTQILKIQQHRVAPSNGASQNERPTSSSTGLTVIGGNTSPSTAMPHRDEKCPHCPFSTNKSDVLKEHMLYHICVSGHINLANCNFCDFSIADESLLTEHNNIHFGLIKNKQKPVAFYTSYDNLEITTIEQQINNNNHNNNNNNNNNNSSSINNNDSNHQNQYGAMKTLYPKINFDLQYSSDKENKILVDVDTGHIMK